MKYLGGLYEKHNSQLAWEFLWWTIKVDKLGEGDLEARRQWLQKRTLVFQLNDGDTSSSEEESEGRQEPPQPLPKGPNPG